MENETKRSGLGADIYSAGYEMLGKDNPVYEEIKAMQPLNLPDQRGLPPSSAGPDYEIMQCPAYIDITVAHGNQEGQQAEISLIQPAGTTAAKDSSEMSGMGPGTCNNQDVNLDDVEDKETGM